MITVVAALIEKDDKVLIARRSSGDPNLLGYWEFPGGKVDEGEDELHAIEREIYEEFELEVEAKEFIINNIYEYPNKTVDLRLYRCEYKSGEFLLHAHSEYKWIDKKDILSYKLAPADIKLAEYVRSK